MFVASARMKNYWATEVFPFIKKFMDLGLSPKRYAEYLYIIIKIGDESLTEAEQEWFDYVRSLPNDTSPVIINCVICRVPRDQLHAAMNGENSMENRLW